MPNLFRQPIGQTNLQGEDLASEVLNKFSMTYFL